MSAEGNGRDPHAEYADLDGAYVLGALSPGEREGFERHLSGCAECRRSVSELTPLPGLLSHLEPADAQLLLDDPGGGRQDLGPPAGLEERLLDAAEAERESSGPRSRRRLVLAGVIAALVAAVAAAALVVPFDVDEGSTDQAPTMSVELRPRAATSLSAEVALTGMPWGTSVEMTCTYPQGDPASYRGSGGDYAGGRAYRLVVLTADGRREVVSRWRAGPGDTVRTSGSSDLGVEEILRLQVRVGASGRVLLAAPTG
ncbi:zf-HC2 domain-containing protein [Nocardioides insulae]|uniref:zf-HC2 domain-containing protein n=1 Tax=Nocardioides insulae TaxID=394734 RepID=UPI0004094484|nr:zf-HC2 domain-containing protein [Nocardioides insulae]